MPRQIESSANVAFYRGDTKSMRRLVMGLMLVSLVPSSWGEQQLTELAIEKPGAFSLICAFAAKNQIFEITLVFGEKQREGKLEVFDTRHKVVVESVRAPVTHENGSWFIKTINNSDSVATSREHEISKSNFAYERRTLIQMGKTPPLILLDRGQCNRLRELHRKG
jgi:hypothetical protein